MPLHESKISPEKQIEAFFELTGVGAAISDVRGRFVRVNKKMCEITGYSASELVGMHFTDLTHPDDQQLSAEKFALARHHETSGYDLEKRYIRKDGSIIWVKIN